APPGQVSLAAASEQALCRPFSLPNTDESSTFFAVLNRACVHAITWSSKIWLTMTHFRRIIRYSPRGRTKRKSVLSHGAERVLHRQIRVFRTMPGKRGMQTLAQILESQARKYGARAFLLDKHGKLWRDHSWTQI